MPYDRPAWQVKPPDVTTYAASYTLTKFHLSRRQFFKAACAAYAVAALDPDNFNPADLPGAQVRGIKGPLGSGKSVGMCWDIMQAAIEQPADDKGIRRSKWVVIRNTYRELEDTTLATWFDWFPEQQFGTFLRRGMTHQVRRTLDDGTELELDVLFRALDKPQDVRKLLSLELTGAWINEAREVPRAILDMLRKRVGRFPKWNYARPYWFGVIMDTNPPDEDNWWYRMAELETPETFEFFSQPSGRSPHAENLANLAPGYYSPHGYSAEWIKVYIDGEYGYVQTGKPVWSEFYEQLHYKPDLQRIQAGITVGVDFGLEPAAVFLQQDARGRYLVIDELVTDIELGAAGAQQFAESLKAHIDRHYRGFEFQFFGDPAGDARSQLDANLSVFKVFRASGIFIKEAPGNNDWVLRRDAVGGPLNTLIDGQPQLVIGGRCRWLRMGMAGKYNYKRVQVKGDDKYHEKPDKNKYSHVCDALQYAMLGAGSSPIRPRGAIGKQRRAPVQADTAFNPWDAFAGWPTITALGRYRGRRAARPPRAPRRRRVLAA